MLARRMVSDDGSCTPTHDWLRPAEAAVYLGVTVHVLFDWRVHNVGPGWVRVADRILYSRNALDHWLADHQCDPLD